jgi:hypothetical protein
MFATSLAIALTAEKRNHRYGRGIGVRLAGGAMSGSIVRKDFGHDYVRQQQPVRGSSGGRGFMALLKAQCL